MNSFALFEELLKKEGVTKGEEIIKRYFSIKSKERDEYKKEFGKLILLNEGFTNILEYIEKNIANYYSPETQIINPKF